jgi:dimethylglycine catabolism A
MKVASADTASAQFPLSASPFSIGPIQLKNRIFQSAHTTNFGSSERAGPSARHIAYHETRARGGVGLIITEGIRIYAPTWRKGRMGAFTDDALDDFAALVAAVNSHGCALFAQLNDPGRHLRLDRVAPISASDVPWTLGGAVPHSLAVPEIRDVVHAFAAAARRMETAGLQGIELQCGHGHLINQFLSPATNHRSDGYGKSPAGRLKLLLEVLDAVRAATTIPVGIRISADEFQDGGLALPDTLQIVSEVRERIPVAFLHVSHSFYAGSASLATQVADMSWSPAPFRRLPRAFKSEFPDLPVMAICRMDDLSVAEDVLASGAADLIGMARPQIADPDLVRKSLSGAPNTVRHCIACNQGCIGRSESGSAISCVVNPEAGLEREFSSLPPLPDAARQRVAVVGGGPAGMQAAIAAGRAGHDVVLYEEAATLGGQVSRLRRLHGRSRFGLLVDEQERDLRALGVEVNPATRADAALVSWADTVVIATGSRPQLATFRGDARSMSTWSVIDDPDGVGDNVVILDTDGGWAGPVLAEHLASRGKQVTVVTPGPMFAPNVTVYSRVALSERLAQLRVAVMVSTQIDTWDGRVVVLTDACTGESVELPAVSTLVQSGPQRAEVGLLDDLTAGEFTGGVHLVGDGYAPRTALEAVYEGHVAGVSIGRDDEPALRALPTFRPALRVAGPTDVDLMPRPPLQGR